MQRRSTIGSGRFVSSFSSEPHAHQQGPSPNYLHRSVSYVLLFWAHREPLSLFPSFSLSFSRSLSLSPSKGRCRKTKKRKHPSNFQRYSSCSSSFHLLGLLSSSLPGLFCSRSRLSVMEILRFNFMNSLTFNHEIVF